jgi:hypothetical protein
MNGTKKSAIFIERQHFCVLSNFMMKGYRSSHHETAASAWQQWHADWWSEMKKTNHNAHHPENPPTNKCGMMDTDDEAAGWLRSTDLHRIIVTALEGHEKKQIHFHALRNNHTSLMCASYMANHPYENVARLPCSSNKISRPQIILMIMVFHCQKWDQKSTN